MDDMKFTHEEEFAVTAQGHYWIYKNGDGWCLRFTTDLSKPYEEITAVCLDQNKEEEPTDWPCISSAREIARFHRSAGPRHLVPGCRPDGR